MNYVAIDPSLSCTAMVVNDVKFVYTTDAVARTKKGELKRWFQECEDQGVKLRVWPDLPEYATNSETELAKLARYEEISHQIVHDIETTACGFEPLTIGIEGYSHSSNAGPLIDLVTISTLIRSKIVARLSTYPTSFVHDGETFFKNAQNPPLVILQPTEVKQRAAKLVYAPIQKGKKVEYRNPDGVAGGSFKKPEIYKALLHNDNLKGDVWVEYLREQSEEILEMKSIPKPIEDINDAKTLYEILKAPQPLNK